MSRKSRKEKSITAEDLGGLDLTVGLPTSPPAATLNSTLVEAIPAPPDPVEVPNGLTLDAALRQSPYSYLAAHPSGYEGTVIVSNGQRFWSATEQGLNPNMHPYNYDMVVERERADWRPVLGNENGLYIA